MDDISGRMAIIGPSGERQGQKAQPATNTALLARLKSRPVTRQSAYQQDALRWKHPIKLSARTYIP